MDWINIIGIAAALVGFPYLVYLFSKQLDKADKKFPRMAAIEPPRELYYDLKDVEAFYNERWRDNEHFKKLDFKQLSPGAVEMIAGTTDFKVWLLKQNTKKLKKTLWERLK